MNRKGIRTILLFVILIPLILNQNIQTNLSAEEEPLPTNKPILYYHPHVETGYMDRVTIEWTRPGPSGISMYNYYITGKLRSNLAFNPNNFVISFDYKIEPDTEL
ncbi:MAG: hypothetical protein ACW99A_17945, partial [Candidatus Kariarchaeaceae archaeon]